MVKSDRLHLAPHLWCLLAICTEPSECVWPVCLCSRVHSVTHSTLHLSAKGVRSGTSPTVLALRTHSDTVIYSQVCVQSVSLWVERFLLWLLTCGPCYSPLFKQVTSATCCQVDSLILISSANLMAILKLISFNLLALRSMYAMIMSSI